MTTESVATCQLPPSVRRKEEDGPEVHPLLRGAIARRNPAGEANKRRKHAQPDVHGLRTHGPETAARKRIIRGISSLFIRTIRASRLTTSAPIIATGRAAGACAACIHTQANSHRRPRGSAGESAPPSKQPPRAAFVPDLPPACRNPHRVKELRARSGDATT